MELENVFSSMTVRELKDILRERSLVLSGTRSDLVHRLVAWELENSPRDTPPKAAAAAVSVSRRRRATVVPADPLAESPKVSPKVSPKASPKASPNAPSQRKAAVGGRRRTISSAVSTASTTTATARKPRGAAAAAAAAAAVPAAAVDDGPLSSPASSPASTPKRQPRSKRPRLERVVEMDAEDEQMAEEMLAPKKRSAPASSPAASSPAVSVPPRRSSGRRQPNQSSEHEFGIVMAGVDGDDVAAGVTAVQLLQKTSQEIDNEVWERARSHMLGSQSLALNGSDQDDDDPKVKVVIYGQLRLLETGPLVLSFNPQKSAMQTVFKTALRLRLSPTHFWLFRRGVPVMADISHAGNNIEGGSSLDCVFTDDVEEYATRHHTLEVVHGFVNPELAASSSSSCVMF